MEQDHLQKVLRICIGSLSASYIMIKYFGVKFNFLLTSERLEMCLYLKIHKNCHF